MTEVPEYLLERSRARRAALGLATGDEPAPAAGGSEPSAAPAVASSAPAPAAGTAAPAAGGSATPSTATETLPRLPSYIPEPGPKSGIPVWMMPVILILPLWAIVYIGAFGEQEASGPVTPIQLGAQVFQRAGCAGCHGARGQGGVGPKLSQGDTKLTFPDEQAHVDFVKQGSGAIRGQPYGDAGRPGGQRTAASGGMPAFGTQLTEDEVRAVVLYERDGL